MWTLFVSAGQNKMGRSGINSLTATPSIPTSQDAKQSTPRNASIIIQHAVLGLLHIIKLLLFDGPDENKPAAGPQTERQHNQNNQTFIHII